MGATPGARALRLLIAAGLAVDAYVHIHLAGRYGPVAHGISQGLLFRIEGGVAILMALIVLASASRFLHFVAFLVAASALGAVLLYRYVKVGPLGPLPDMYDPTWYPEKTWSAVAEGAATVCAALLVFSRGGAAQPKKPKGSYKYYS
ncbi:MAG TPA: hypothetical protein VH352_00965 [Pseudonocardiaceae bacterium]|nr:hypothetical protein [Pseudonocardiaceae bacterium]